MRTIETIIQDAISAYKSGDAQTLKSSLNALDSMPGGITQDIMGKLRLSPMVISKAMQGEDKPSTAPAEVRSNMTGLTLSEIAAKISALNSKGVMDTLSLGKYLSMAKEDVKHGEWLGWLKDNTLFTRQHAAKLIKVNHRFGNGTSMLHLKPDLLFAMIETPERFELEIANAITQYEASTDTDITFGLLQKLNKTLVGIKEVSVESILDVLKQIKDNANIVDDFAAVKNATTPTSLSEMLLEHTKAVEVKAAQQVAATTAENTEHDNNFQASTDSAVVTTPVTPVPKSPAQIEEEAREKEKKLLKMFVDSVKTAYNNSWEVNNSSLDEIAKKFMEQSIDLDKLETFISRLKKVQAVLLEDELNQLTNNKD